MLRTAGLRMFAFVLVLLALALGQHTPAFAQAAEDDPTNAATAEEGAEEIQEKDEFTPGDANPVDIGPAIEVGPNRLFIPSLSGNGNAEARPAAVDATILLDEFCSFPSGWSVVDDNPTPPVRAWTQQVVLGRCVARPNVYESGMSIRMTRVVNTIGGNIAGANLTFRFRMNTETGFDFLRYEFSCNNRRTWRGVADSGAFGGSSFVSRTISLIPCDESSSVYIRFWFHTDSSVIGAERPALDSVTVTD